MIWNLIQKRNALMQIALCKKKDKDYDQLILKFSNIIKIRRKLINGKESVLLSFQIQGPPDRPVGFAMFESHMRLSHSFVGGPEIPDVKWGTPSRWSFRPISAWSSIETTTTKKTHPTLSKKRTYVIFWAFLGHFLFSFYHKK